MRCPVCEKVDNSDFLKCEKCGCEIAMPSDIHVVRIKGINHSHHVCSECQKDLRKWRIAELGEL
jgi:RNA polymerase-binding transcription factor DksA